MTQKFNQGMHEVEENDVPGQQEVFGLTQFDDKPRSREVRIEYRDNPNALMRGEDGNLHFANYTLTPTGIEIEGEIDGETWKGLGLVLFGLDETLPIWLGDYLVQTELKWNEDYKAIAAVFNRDPATLYNYRWVMGAVPKSLRAERLTFGHYKLVAGIEDVTARARLLHDAVMNNWSARQLESEIRRSKSLPSLFSTFNKSAAVIKRAYQNPQDLKGKKLDAARAAVIKLRAWLDEFEQRLGAEE